MRSRQAGVFLCFRRGLLFVFWTGAIAEMERSKEQEEAEGAVRGKGWGAAGFVSFVVHAVGRGGLRLKRMVASPLQGWSSYGLVRKHGVHRE